MTKRLWATLNLFSMKRIFYTILHFTLFSFCFQACKKNTNNSSSSSLNEALIELSKRFFEDQVQQSPKLASGSDRLTATKNPDWTTARVLQLSKGTAVVVPVHYLRTLLVKTNFGGSKLFNLNEITHLVIYKDLKSVYHAELVISLPDSNALNPRAKDFTGIAFVEDWKGKRLHQFKFNSGGTILNYNSQFSVTDKSSSIGSIVSTQVTPATVIATCYEISGYNYSPDDPEGGYSWSEPAGCDYQYIPETIGGGDGLSGADYGSIAGGGGRTVSLSQIIIQTGPNIIGNIQDYFKCFTNVGGSDHLYNVTLCVDQPVPGTRLPWGFADGASGTSATHNPFDVGHTFLIFSESYGGTTITRNVGFYPRTIVNPFYPSDQGQLNDNESSGYNISLTATVTNAQFFNMLNYASQGNNAGYLYNLNSNNCTTFAIDALQAGSVNISTQTGTWFKGGGYDPGDLGEDIRNMPLPPNMTRNTVDNPHPNIGQCN
jgi:hypothetical protein